jgi:hypothetical protein
MKLKQLFENAQSFPTSREEVELALKTYGIRNYTINDDLTVDVNGDVFLRSIESKLPIQFGRVSGDFSCFGTRLLSLQGAPKEVGGNFDCDSNLLVSLQYSPREVGGSFNCVFNRLVSLQYSPREVGGSFNCSRNQLASLRGAPREVGGDFLCRRNPNLSSLDGIGQVHGQIYSDIS